jgi:hypothetical protein
MNAPKHFAAATKADQGKKLARRRNPDAASEEAPFDEQRQLPNGVWQSVLDNRTFEAFVDGAGI